MISQFLGVVCTGPTRFQYQQNPELSRIFWILIWDCMQSLQGLRQHKRNIVFCTKFRFCCTGKQVSKGFKKINTNFKLHCFIRFQAVCSNVEASTRICCLLLHAVHAADAAASEAAAVPPPALPMLPPLALHLLSPLKVQMQHVHQNEICVLSLLENERRPRKRQ